MTTLFTPENTLMVRESLQIRLVSLVTEKRIAIKEKSFHRAAYLNGQIDATNEIMAMLNEVI